MPEKRSAAWQDGNLYKCSARLELFKLRYPSYLKVSFTLCFTYPPNPLLGVVDASARSESVFVYFMHTRSLSYIVDEHLVTFPLLKRIMYKFSLTRLGVVFSMSIELKKLGPSCYDYSCLVLEVSIQTAREEI